MLTYYSQLPSTFSGILASLYENRLEQITKKNNVIVLGNYEIVEYIKMMGLTLGRLAHGMESRTFNTTITFSTTFDITQNALLLVTPACNYLRDSFGLDYIKNNPFELVNILEALGFCIGNMIYTNGISTNAYSTPKLNGEYINNFINNYILFYAGIAINIVGDNTVTGELANEICYSVGKAFSRASYAMETLSDVGELRETKSKYYNPKIG